MNKKSKYLFVVFAILVSLTAVEILYLHQSKSLDENTLKKKEAFISMIGLPDLAISTEAMFIRHRSLSSVFAIFSESPELTEYFPSTFTYSHSHLQYNTPSKFFRGTLEK